MAYLLNVTLPSKGNLMSALRAVYGIGLTRSAKLVSILGLKRNAKVSDITQAQLNKLGAIVDKVFIIDAELKRKVSMAIKILKETKSYRGYRHSLGLPTRGQRTHTNASTHRKISKINLNNMSLRAENFSLGSNNLNKSNAKKNQKTKTKVKNKVKVKKKK